MSEHTAAIFERLLRGEATSEEYVRAVRKEVRRRRRELRRLSPSKPTLVAPAQTPPQAKP